MQLVSATRNGQDLAITNAKPGEITVQPERDTDMVRLWFTRTRLESGWLRQCQTPSITVNGVTLKSSYRLTAASDTFAPASIGSSTEMLSGGRASLFVTPGSNRLLMHRNLLMGLGWLIAFFVFATNWLIAERSKYGFYFVLTFVVVSVSASILWWPWQLALIGWFVLPATAAGLLQASRVYREESEKIAEQQIRQIQGLEDVSADFSVSTPMLSILFLFGSFFSMGTIACPSTASAQPTGITPSSIATIANQANADRVAESESKPIDVFVPVDVDVQSVGNKVYISGKSHRELFAEPNLDEPAEPFFESATYWVNVDLPRDAEMSATVGVTAEYVIHLDRPSTRIRLPFVAPAVRRVQLLLSDQTPIAQFNNDASGNVIADIPHGESFRLKLTLNPEVVFAASVGQARVLIPSIPSSRLIVEADRMIDVISLGGSAGPISRTQEMGRWDVPIGRTNQLKVDFRVNQSGAADSELPLNRTYRILAGNETTVIECEVQPPTPMRAGDVMQLSVFDDEAVSVANSAWRLDRVIRRNSGESQLTVSKTVDEKIPLTLVWQKQSRTADGELDMDQLVMAIPDVLPSRSTIPVGPAIIGLAGDAEVRLTDSEQNPITELNPETFMQQWTGYKAPIHRAVQTESRLPSLIFVPDQSVSANVTQRNQLHISGKGMVLSLKAEILDESNSMTRRVIELPKGLLIQELQINGAIVDHPVVRWNNRGVIPVGDRRDDSGTMRVSAIGFMRLPQEKTKIDLPLMRLGPNIGGTMEYLVTRDHTASVRVSGAANTEEPNSITDELRLELLAQGMMPVELVDYELDGTNDRKTQISVTRRNRRIASSQLIAMSFDSGRWSMDTAVRFNSAVPDFVDVEIPSQWCNEVAVSSEALWLIRDSVIPSRKVLRIACDRKEFSESGLVIHGELENTDESRIAVPNVSILGEGQRNIYVSVPKKLTNELINWQRKSVNPSAIPPPWRRQLANSNFPLDDSAEVYVADSDAWSVDMQPLNETAVDATVLAAETQIFVGADDVLAICRWDVVPESIQYVDVQLPNEAVCEGAWAANQPVNVTIIPDDAVAKSNATSQSSRDSKQMPGGDIIRIPLSLSRLTQGVEVMVRMPLKTRKGTGSVPFLVGMETPTTWISVFQPMDVAIHNEVQKDHSYNLSSRNTKRSLALARSTIQAIRQSLDSVAERRSDEVALWLKPWVARYVSLARSSGHWSDFSSNKTESDSPTDSDWLLLDQEMGAFVNRFIPDTSDLVPPHLDSRRMLEFSLSDIQQWQIGESMPTIKSRSARAEDLRDLMGNVLSLSMVCLMLALIWPQRQRIRRLIVHPSFWMFLIGLMSLFVAPIPVALAIMLTAVILPTIQLITH